MLPFRNNDIVVTLPQFLQLVIYYVQFGGNFAMYREREKKENTIIYEIRNRRKLDKVEKKKIVKNTNLLWKIHVKETIISMRSEKCRIVDS